MRIRARLVVGLCLAIAVLFAADESSYTGWSDYLGGPDSAQYSALKQINKSNVAQLQVAWTYATGDKNSYSFNPIVVDGVMYALARNNAIVALDAATGREIWVHPNDTRSITTRGINYWESKDRSDRRLLYCVDSYLLAINARTGDAISSFGETAIRKLWRTFKTTRPARFLRT